MKSQVCCLLLFFLTINLFSQSLFERMDRDRDGKLSQKEFKGSKRIFMRLDKNGDNFISNQEAKGTRLTKRMGKRREADSFPPAVPQPPKSQKPLKYINTHDHLMALYMEQGKQKNDFESAASNALTEMDRCGVKLNFIMPPPQTIDQQNPYNADELVKIVKKYPTRFAFLGGGGTLNKMIQEALKSKKVTGSMRKKFEQTANKWLKAGAVGFGEMTACHFSFNKKHPFITAPPDHALFLLLADIAAKNNVPIDLHMEAVPKRMSMPKDFNIPPNPWKIEANIPDFERLLKHNRKTKIVWAHLGWDNTGFRKPDDTRKILAKHPNLYMSIRIPSELHIKQTPEASRIVDANGELKKEWLAVFKEFPDRFFIGSDEFYMSGRRKKRHGSSGSLENTCNFLAQLPADLAKKIGYENAQKVYNLKKTSGATRK